MNQFASTFSAIATVKAAWAQVKGCKGAFWLVLLGALLACAVRTLLGNGVGLGVMLAVGLIKIILSLLYVLLIWGALYLGIQRAKAQIVQAKMVSYVFDIALFFKMIGLYLLQILIFLPLILFLLLSIFLFGSSGNVSNLIQVAMVTIGVVVAIYLAMRLYLTKAIVIAEKINPWAAIKRSFNATRSHVWQLIGVSLINIGVLLLGILTIGIGLIWVFPYLFINYGVVYHRLTAIDSPQ